MPYALLVQVQMHPPPIRSITPRSNGIDHTKVQVEDLSTCTRDKALVAVKRAPQPELAWGTWAMSDEMSVEPWAILHRQLGEHRALHQIVHHLCSKIGDAGRSATNDRHL